MVTTMRQIAKTLAVLSLAVLQACAGQTELQASQARQDVAPSPGYGRLVIYLHNPVFGSIDVNRYNIAVDNIVIGTLTGTNALMIDLPAGAHHVQASNDISKQIGGKDNFERLNSVSPLVAAGMTSYVQITQVPLMPAPKLELADPSVGFSIVAVHARTLADARQLGLLPAALSGPQPVARFWPTPQNGIPPAPTVASVPPTPAASPVPQPASPALPPARDVLAGISYPLGSPRPDDVAVIIGNSDYSRSRDIPGVPPAGNDAEAMRRYAVQALGIREGNVIYVRNATGTQLTEIFGNERDYKGRLYDYVRPGRSRVFVYYAGHGAPVGQGTAVLVPVDATPQALAISGYPLSQLYANLGKLPAESVTVVLEACFSGVSEAGAVIPSASPVLIKPKASPVPPGLTVIAAGAADQIASWDPDKIHGLFTEQFLLGMSGEAVKPPYGNGSGKVTLDELNRYLKDNVTYLARRYWGRDQQVQIVRGDAR